MKEEPIRGATDPQIQLVWKLQRSRNQAKTTWHQENWEHFSKINCNLFSLIYHLDYFAIHPALSGFRELLLFLYPTHTFKTVSSNPEVHNYQHVRDSSTPLINHYGLVLTLHLPGYYTHAHTCVRAHTYPNSVTHPKTILTLHLGTPTHTYTPNSVPTPPPPKKQFPKLRERSHLVRGLLWWFTWNQAIAL